MRENPVVFFVEGANDPVRGFDAKGVRHVPLASGPEDCDTRVSVSIWPRARGFPRSQLVRTSCGRDGRVSFRLGRL